MNNFGIAVIGLAVVLHIVGILASVASIGKERKPITPGMAVGSAIISGAMILLFSLMLAGK